MKTEYDIELLSFLREQIERKSVVIHENTNSFFEEIENYYPVGFSGIDWSEKNTHCFIDLGADKSITPLKAKGYLQQILESLPELSNEDIVVIGDGLTSLGFQMKFADLVEVCTHFFIIPQHTYVWFLAAKKCINLTFEDELYFDFDYKLDT